jgi:death on curing protein
VHIDDVTWLEVAHVHAAHDEAMRYGLPEEDHGVKDIGLIDSAVMAPRNSYPESLAELAAAYVYSIAKNHGYQNGNKRTAAIVLVMFLEMNGVQVVLADEWIGILERVADSQNSKNIGKHELIDLITSRLLGGVDVPIEY